MVVAGGPAFINLLAGAIIVAAFYLAREILIPVVLAVLLTFVLTPIVTLLQRWRVPRTVAVIAAALVAIMIILSLGSMVASQVNQLAGELPRYQATLREKVQHLRDNFVGPGVFRNLADLLSDLDKELDRPRSTTITVAPGEANPQKEQRPLPVEIHQPPPSVSERLVSLFSPLVSPLTTTGIVLLFATFFLFQREDLRNRIIRLAGSHDIERTTAALNDAGHRLQRLFAMQLLLNAAFGFVIGLGLTLIGVPNAPLWGLLAMVLRFVPYVGAILCALLPITLAAAVGPDWSMVLWTVLLFAVVEPFTAQVAEPLAYGHRTGLSPVAVVLSAVFWTWLWGPIGLLVSTPLTLCVVVLSRHVERLKFIDIMFGDQPPLTPQQVLYQRMLAGDPVEAADHAARALKKISVFDYCNDVLLGALKLAQADLDRGRLDSDRVADINHCVDEIIDDLTELEETDTEREPKAPLASDKDASTNIVRLSGRDHPRSIAALPGRGRLDRAAALIVAFIAAREGFKAEVPKQSAPSLADFGNAVAVCVCQVSPLRESVQRYTVRRLRRTGAKQPLIIVALGSHVAPDHRSRPETTVTTLDGVIDALRAIKPDSAKPQARPD
ncbi:AI-2E family transporter [Bradyrhizobium sp. LHD-71]|uniref:AI-2E family transporter n=1 Tax=Bradyrhizobium sp. LHD-71 TaxID=3072141 RepID=UPI002810074C|nr:AI-2E family transporter [Bradyrhizobium sp. LHD-71]MDQ8729380.1 AI-2E family transporter [Bradyrhizobium sp. LHD-71]